MATAYPRGFTLRGLHMIFTLSDGLSLRSGGHMKVYYNACDFLIMSNQPDRFALFILGPKEKRVEIIEDSHIANAVTVVLNKEDHTMGNMLRHAVLAVPGVVFSGYRVPHPLEPRTVLKIQTDGSITPVQALKAGCEKVISQIGKVRASFKAQCQLFDDQAGLGSGATATAGVIGDEQVQANGGYGRAYAGSSGTGFGGYGDMGQRHDRGASYVDI